MRSQLQQVIFYNRNNDFTPKGYLQLTKHKQTLCHNQEGWGPSSPYRWDFTPCFLDVWVTIVAAFGIILGSAAAWYLHRNSPPQQVRKNWHFFAKMGVLWLFILDLALQSALLIEYLGGLWVTDFRFWSSLALLAASMVILYIQYIEHWRSRTPNSIVLLFWLLLVIVLAVKLRSLVIQEMHELHLAYFVTYVVGFTLAILEFGLEYLIPKKVSAYDALGDEYECPYEYADIFSVLTFGWMTPLMKAGYKNYLTQDDLWNLRKQDTTESTGDAFNQAWALELNKKKPRLWIALARAYGIPYLHGAFVKVPSDIFQYIQPYLLKLLMNFVSNYRSQGTEPLARGWAITLTMFAVSVASTICLNQYFQKTFETGMRVRSGLTGAIYAKAMRLSNEGRSSKSTGDVVNYMAVDAQRLQDLAQFLQQTWSAPFQITLCMTFLYQLVGPSMFAGVGIMVIMIPINGVISKVFKKLQKIQMNNKDQRTRLMNEILNNMKSIKLYAWNTAFMNKLNHVRNDLELNTLRKIGAAQALANLTWSTTPFFVSCATFTIYTLTQKEPLTVDIVFPALALFNLLTFPLQILPMLLNNIVEALVAVERLTSFLTAEELQPDAVRFEEATIENGEESVKVTDATFTWNKHEPENTLEHINFSANKGELSCIVGRVGAGKTSLLQALIGDLYKSQGEVIVRGKVAYVAQNSWITNGSVKDNITFGHRFDPIFYDQTIKACALNDDLTQLPEEDNTLVGERGISLSGGQKARVSLARAVYARADIYLLDDVLSAVDQHVGRHIIDNVLGPNGLLSGKTRILATNSIPVLKDSDFVVLLRDGKIFEKGTYQQLLAMKGEVANIIKTSSSDEPPDSPLSTSTASEETVYLEGEEDELSALSPRDERHDHDTLAPLQSVTSNGRQAQARRQSNVTLRRASTASNRGIRRSKPQDEEQAVNLAQNKERFEQGKVKWSVYAAYAASANTIAVVIWLFVLISAQCAQIGGSVWLKHWSESNGQSGANQHTGKFIGVYFALGIGFSSLNLIQTLLLWIFCSIEASRKLHERMAFAIFRAPMSFFETTPIGRILNRFSSDIYRVDEVIARSFNQLFTNLAKASFTLITISVATPWFAAIIAPLGGVYYYIQRYYLRSSRELKRLESVSRSPIFAHFQESITGASTIRAYGQQKRFSQENEYRVDANMRAYFPNISANRWLAIRLELMGSIVIFFASSFAVLGVAQGRGPSAGLLGLAMSYALQITGSLNWIVRQTVEVETNIISVERVLEYAALPSEAPDIVSKKRPPISWPSLGAVNFNNYSAKYRPELDLVLKNVNLNIKPKEKIGVVGRTGAGKSTLTLALFRIIEASDGNISIDDLDIGAIGLMDVRKRLAIIPQDAALFEGTVRDNLDPGHIHDDTDLWSALENARLKEHVSKMPGKLEAKIHEGGSNLSSGQRQLISLARALLAPSNILVLDEATAAVDVETDALLQATLRGARFRDRTIVTIAHRINTILDSDRVVVLRRGQVAEFDTPKKLVAKGGLFYDLVKEAGLLGSV